MTFTAEEKIKIRHQIEAEICKRSLFEFFKYAAPVLQPAVEWDFNWHIEYVSNLLQEETQRMLRGAEKEHDYIINWPFRSSKSTLISIIYPVWVWLQDPSISIITVSATEALAVKFSHQSKILIESQWFQDRFSGLFQLRQDSKSKGNFMNEHNGRRESFGINSAIIGSGADIMLLDDIQSPDDITALALRNTIQSFQDVLYSRLNNPRINFRICLQQRVHENDISGYLQRTAPDKWNVVTIPAILTNDLKPPELSTKYIDGLFWPQRFSTKILDDFRATMRPNMYAAQLLQRPTLEEGDLIKRVWFKTQKYSDIMDKGIEWHMILDTAFTDNTKNDPTGILILGKYNNNIIIRKAYQRWKQFNELLEEIKELQKIYAIKKIYVETKASGISIVQELKRQTSFNVLPLTPGTRDKITRVNSCLPAMESGRVILIEDPEWNDWYLSELTTFPMGTHDDLVDCTTYSIEEFLNKTGTTIFR